MDFCLIPQILKGLAMFSEKILHFVFLSHMAHSILLDRLFHYDHEGCFFDQGKL